MTYHSTVWVMITFSQISQVNIMSSELLLHLEEILCDNKVLTPQLNTTLSTRKSKKPSNKHLKCLNCERTGHSKESCWEKGGGKEG